MDLSDIAPYSIVLGKRTRNISSISNIPLPRRVKVVMKNVLVKINPLRALRSALRIE